MPLTFSTMWAGRRTPPLAIAEYATAICIGVTAMPWPIGRLPIEAPEYLASGSTMPLSSPGRSVPVGLPKPKRRTHWSNFLAPSRRPIVTAPTLEDCCEDLAPWSA